MDGFSRIGPRSISTRPRSPSSHSAPPIFQRAVGAGPLAFSCLVLLWDQSIGANAFWASSQGSWFVDCHRPFPRFSQGPCTRWAKVLHSCRAVLPDFQLSGLRSAESLFLPVTPGPSSSISRPVGPLVMMLSLPPPPPLSPTPLRPSLKSPCVAVSSCLLGTGTPLAARVDVMDTWGDHALSCCCGGDRVLRHYAIRNVVCFAVAEFTSFSPELEKTRSSASPASSRPEGTVPELTRALTLLAAAAPMSGFPVAFPDSPRRGIFRFHLCCAPPHISSAAPLGRRCFCRGRDSQASFPGHRFLVLEACGGGFSPHPPEGRCLDFQRIQCFAWCFLCGRLSCAGFSRRHSRNCCFE